jgi:hypothetical protein
VKVAWGETRPPGERVGPGEEGAERLPRQQRLRVELAQRTRVANDADVELAPAKTLHLLLAFEVSNVCAHIWLPPAQLAEESLKPYEWDVRGRSDAQDHSQVRGPPRIGNR